VVEPRDKECLLAEAAKLQRYLGISPEAGLDQAIQLAKSEDPAKRRLAVNIFGDVGGPRVRNFLDLLSKDSDGNVRSASKNLSFDAVERAQ
jgi:HEAT repeat protein